MNLYKIALSLLVTAAPLVSARSSAEENSAIRELAAKFDAKFDHLQTENDALKAKIASLEKKGSRNSTPKEDKKSNVRRGMQEIPLPEGFEIPDDIPEITEADLEGIVGMGMDPNLSNLLFGLIHKFNQLVGLANCVSYDFAYTSNSDADDVQGACTFGSADIPNVFITSSMDIEINAPDDIGIFADDDIIIRSSGDDVSIEADRTVFIQQNTFPSPGGGGRK